MDFWTQAISLALITAGLIFAIDSNPMVNSLKSFVADKLMTKPQICSYVVYGMNCLICQSFWISLIAMILMKMTIVSWMTGYGICVIIIMVLTSAKSKYE